MKFCKLLTRFMTLALLITSNANAGIVVGATRVIFTSDDKEKSLKLTNTTEGSVYLVQSWISPADESKAKTPFIVTPPLFRLDAHKENLLRIVRLSDVTPQDRESFYWLNIKQIPAMSENADKNSLQIVVKSKMRLFYRPEGLTGSPNTAYKALTFSKTGAKLKIINPTEYYISFFSLTVDNKKIEQADIIAPKSEVEYSMPSTAGHTVRWESINDSGGINEALSREI